MTQFLLLDEYNELDREFDTIRDARKYMTDYGHTGRTLWRYKTLTRADVPDSDPGDRFITETNGSSTINYLVDTSRAGASKDGKFVLGGFSDANLPAAALSAMAEAANKATRFLGPFLTIVDKDGDIADDSYPNPTWEDLQRALNDLDTYNTDDEEYDYGPYRLVSVVPVAVDEKDTDRYTVDQYAGNVWIVDTHKPGRSQQKFHPVTTFEGSSRDTLTKIAAAASNL